MELHRQTCETNIRTVDDKKSAECRPYWNRSINRHSSMAVNGEQKSGMRCRYLDKRQTQLLSLPCSLARYV